VAPFAQDEERLRRLQSLTDAALAHLDLVARAAVGLEEEVERGVRIPVGRGFAGRIAATRQPVVLDDVDHADVLNPLLREKGIKSLLGVPLVLGDAMLGVLHVGTLTPRRFGPDEVELMQFAGDRAALAIDHARLFAAERAARERLEHLQAVTDVALEHLELQELLDVLLPRIRTILHADTCAVLLLEEETQELVARAAVGIEEEVEQGVRIPVGGGFAGRVAAEVRPIVLDDVDHAHVLNPILREKGIKSLLGVPLVSRGVVLGVLHVGTLVHRRFTRADEELLQLVAARVALAIERARLHSDIVELDQLKLNFVAVASHELRTPAASVYGALATLTGRGAALSEETRGELLRLAFEQAERLRRLIEQLLDLSRLDARAIAVSPEPVPLAPALAGIAAGAVPDAAHVRVEAPPETVHVDPLVVERVVTNLLVNAARHGAPPFTVTATLGDEQLRIAVRDAGPGIPDELVPRLFDRFASGAGRGGTGLGLAIASAYAEAHGGTLAYVPGAGACFELSLPLARQPDAATTGSASAA